MGGDCEASRIAHVNLILVITHIVHSAAYYSDVFDPECSYVTFWLKHEYLTVVDCACNGVYVRNRRLLKRVLSSGLSHCVVLTDWGPLGFILIRIAKLETCKPTSITVGGCSRKVDLSSTGRIQVHSWQTKLHASNGRMAAT